MISVVIPTRNRYDLLNSCLDKILNNSVKPRQIIIIDSSDTNIRKSFSHLSPTIEHEFTEVKSAAVQRNIGIDRVNTNCNYLAFLDDDVLVPKNYFADLLSTFKELDCVGVSGVAINLGMNDKNKKSKFVNLISKFFLLDSRNSGKLLSSGVNVSIKEKSNKPLIVEWLIGCSIWDYKRVRSVRFEKDFYGQSLGEDVLYSIKAAKIGTLAVNTNVILNHLESEIMRSSDEDFMFMWVKNRLKIVKAKKPKSLIHFSFH
jgi:glycosyltransferase involved in cell wall biosynthesis